MIARCAHFIAFAAGLAASTGAVQAQGLDDIVELELLPGWRMDNGRHMAGLRISLAPGWKTYWRSPGDAGIPPLFDWSGSDNLSGVAFHWPVPEVSYQNGMRSIGYEGDVILPMEFTLGNAAGGAEVTARVQLGVCEEVCIPVDLTFAGTLPTDGGRDGAIVAALVDRPLSAAEAGVGAVICDVEPMEDGLRLVADLTMPQDRQGETVVIETGDPQVWVSEARVEMQGNRLRAVSEMLHVDGGAFVIDRSEVRITVLAGGEATEVVGCEAS